MGRLHAPGRSFRASIQFWHNAVFFFALRALCFKVPSFLKPSALHENGVTGGDNNPRAIQRRRLTTARWPPPRLPTRTRMHTSNNEPTD
jgi:hypothetical protein